MTQSDAMTSAETRAARMILRAATTPATLEDLCRAGTVRGEFGLTALAARSLVERMARGGALSVRFDACHCRTFTATT